VARPPRDDHALPGQQLADRRQLVDQAALFETASPPWAERCASWRTERKSTGCQRPGCDIGVEGHDEADETAVGGSRLAEALNRSLR